MSKKFESQYFDTVEELMAAKSTMEQDGATRARRRRIIRQFSNGLATMSPEEAQTLGQTEIVNHLTTFKYLSQRKKRLEQTFTSTRAFIEVRIDRDTPERDTLDSLKVTQTINRGCLYDGTEFSTFIKSSAGEVQISGGMPVMLQDKGGWAPKLATNMLFPKGCGLAACDVPYAMAPKQYTLAELEGLHKQIGEKAEGVNVSKKAVEELIRVLKKKPRGEGIQTGGSNILLKQSENVGSVIDEPSSDRNATVDAWWFYEVKTNDQGIQHVSGTFFTQDIDLGKNGEGTGPQVLAYFEKLFNSPKDWLHLICMDMEIGGDVTWDSVRGIAEIMFPSSSEMEVLLNLIIQGDKERARPKYQETNDAVADQVLAWDPENTPFVPKGIASFDMKGSSAPLLTPFQMLMGNAAGLAAGPVSNGPGGGELLRQQQERQSVNTVMQFGDMSDWTCQLEQVAYAMVERILAGTIKPGARGYHQVMWVRTCLEKYGLDLKKLMLKEHGRLKYITVRVRRVIGEGGLDTEMGASDFLMGIYSKLAPQKRQKVLQMAIATKTQDPDLAEDLVTISVPIINAQKLDAENECDTIFRLAALGMPVTTKPGDIDQDHLPVHLLAMVAKLSKHQLRPWDRLDVLEFSALQRHAQDHLENLLGDKDTNPEGVAFLPQFQEIVQAAAAIVATVEEREGQEQQQLTPKEQADIQLKTMAEQRKGMELGARIENNQSLIQARNARQAQVGRQGYVRELGDAARFDLERRSRAKQLELEGMRTKAQVKALEAKSFAESAQGTEEPVSSG